MKQKKKKWENSHPVLCISSAENEKFFYLFFLFIFLNEKKRELLKNSRLNFINDQDEVLYSVMPVFFYRQYLVQNYQKIKTSTITVEANREDKQKVKKKKVKMSKAG